MFRLPVSTDVGEMNSDDRQTNLKGALINCRIAKRDAQGGAKPVKLCQSILTTTAAQDSRSN